MAEALISRRGGGGGYSTIKFDNYTFSNNILIRGSAPNLGSSTSTGTAATVGDYALFAGCGGKEVYAYNSNLIRTTLENLSVSRYNFAATTVGNYALFAGGSSSSVDAYNINLVKSTPSSLNCDRYNFAATTVGDYALFAGGSPYSSKYSIFDNDSSEYSSYKINAYNSNLVKSSLNNAYQARLAATTVGSYALFAGGGYSYETSYGSAGGFTSDRVFTVSTNLTTGSTSSLNEKKYGMGATTVGNYALFAGGTAYTYSEKQENISRYEHFSTVEAYDTNLTKKYVSYLGSVKAFPGATTMGNYAIFAGGSFRGEQSTSTNSLSTVDVYTDTLTKSYVDYLSFSASSPAATTIGNHALFVGGGETKVDTFSIGVSIDLFKDSRYKFQGMDTESIVTEECKKIEIISPATGYIKIKNVTLS